MQIQNGDRRGFVMLPNGVVRAKHPTHFLNALAVVASFAGLDGDCFATQATLADMIGVSAKTIQRATAYWERLGCLRVERRNGAPTVIKTTLDFTAQPRTGESEVDKKARTGESEVQTDLGLGSPRYLGLGSPT